MNDTNDTIAFQSNIITQANHNCESLSQNLFYLLVAKVNQSGGKKLSHIIDRKVLQLLAKKSKINVSELTDACTALQELKMQFIHKGKWHSWVLVPTAEVTEDYMLSMRLNEDFVNYFTKENGKEGEVKLEGGITYYQLAMILQLKKKWSKRFYLYCCQYRVAKRFSIDFISLKIKLGLVELDKNDKIKKDKYLSIKRFEERVLVEARNELLQMTDLYFDYKIDKKKGDNTITFEIKKTDKEGKFQLELGFNEADPEKSKQTLNLKNKLFYFGLSEKHSEIILEHIDHKSVKNTIEFVEKKLSKDPTSIPKPGPYLLTSFKNLAPDLDW